MFNHTFQKPTISSSDLGCIENVHHLPGNNLNSYILLEMNDNLI